MGQIPATLTARQRRCVDALMHAKTVQAAATEANVARSTLYRWMELPEFVAALRSAQRHAIEHATRLLSDGAAGAVATLIALSKKADKDSVRTTAANSLLARLLELRTHDDFEQRLAALEAAQNGK